VYALLAVKSGLWRACWILHAEKKRSSVLDSNQGPFHVYLRLTPERPEDPLIVVSWRTIFCWPLACGWRFHEKQKNVALARKSKFFRAYLRRSQNPWSFYCRGSAESVLCWDYDFLEICFCARVRLHIIQRFLKLGFWSRDGGEAKSNFGRLFLNVSYENPISRIWRSQKSYVFFRSWYT